MNCLFLYYDYKRIQFNEKSFIINHKYEKTNIEFLCFCFFDEGIGPLFFEYKSLKSIFLAVCVKVHYGLLTCLINNPVWSTYHVSFISLLNN